MVSVPCQRRRELVVLQARGAVGVPHQLDLGVGRDRLAGRPQARPAGGELRPHRRAVGPRRPVLRGVLRRLRHGVGRPGRRAIGPRARGPRARGHMSPRVSSSPGRSVSDSSSKVARRHRAAPRRGAAKSPAAGGQPLELPAPRPRSAGHRPNAAARPGKPELVAGSQESRVGARRPGAALWSVAEGHRPARNSDPHHVPGRGAWSTTDGRQPARVAGSFPTPGAPAAVCRGGQQVHPERLDPARWCRSGRPVAATSILAPAFPALSYSSPSPTTKAICASDRSA